MLDYENNLEEIERVFKNLSKVNGTSLLRVRTFSAGFIEFQDQIKILQNFCELYNDYDMNAKVIYE